MLIVILTIVPILLTLTEEGMEDDACIDFVAIAIDDRQRIIDNADKKKNYTMRLKLKAEGKDVSGTGRKEKSTVANF